MKRLIGFIALISVLYSDVKSQSLPAAIIAISTTPSSSFSPDGITSSNMTYLVVGSFTPGNQFRVQLSDSNGLFNSPVNIGIKISQNSGVISFIIPANTPEGSGYKLRLASTSPVIYSASIPVEIKLRTSTLSAISGSHCSNTNLSIRYTVSGSYNNGNIFQLELSDASGNFNNPIVLNSQTGTGSGSISGLVPLNTIASNNYKIRLSTTDPASTSLPSAPFTVMEGVNDGDLVGDSSRCSCDSYNIYTATGFEGATNFDFSYLSGSGQYISNNPNPRTFAALWEETYHGTKTLQVRASNNNCSKTKTITINTEPKHPVDMSVFAYYGMWGNTHYYYSRTANSWQEAKRTCENNCGTLFVANTEAELEYVGPNILPTESGRWVGLSDEISEGNFWWLDGTPLNPNIYNIRRIVASYYDDENGWRSIRTPPFWQYCQPDNYNNQDYVKMSADIYYAVYTEPDIDWWNPFSYGENSERNWCASDFEYSMHDENNSQTPYRYIMERKAIEYTQVLALDTSYKGVLCASPFLNYDIKFTASNTYNSDNVFIAQLSNLNGSFVQPVQIGSVQSDTAGTIEVNIPTNIPSGTNYKIRVVSTSPKSLNTYSIDGIKIGNPPLNITITRNPSSILCTGTNTLFTVTPIGGSGNFTYQWQINGQNVGTNSATYSSASLPNNSRVSCIISSMGECKKESPGINIEYAQGIVYVNAAANGRNNGTSWTNAFVNLQDGINFAAQCGAQVWVAAGTYYPNSYPSGCTNCSSNRDFAFSLANNVAVYGGFNGTETSLSDRNFKLNPCVLSGNIGSSGSINDNCYHVIVSAGNDSSSVLDGFTIKNGYGKLSNIVRNVGSLNISSEKGAGIYLKNSSAKLTNLIIENNECNKGGGIYTENSNCSVFKSFLTGNRAFFGSGIANNSSSPSFINVVISGNIGSFGQDAFGAGLYNEAASSPKLTYCTIAGNSSKNGSALYNTDNGTNPVVQNCIIWDNTLTGTGAHLFNTSGAAPQVSYSILPSGTAGTNLLNITPQFNQLSDPNGADNIWGTSDDGLIPHCSSSPARDAGSPTPFVSEDVTGSIRPLFGGYDIGAYETNSPLAQTSVNLSISQGTSSICSGSSITFVATPTNGGNAPQFKFLINGQIVQSGALSSITLNSLNDGDSVWCEMNSNAPCTNSNSTVSSNKIGISVSTSSNGIIYVKHNATGNNNGSSWADAFTSLQTAIDSSSPCSQIWVAEGTYFPTAPPAGCSNCSNSKTYSFSLKDNVALYGGFTGNETLLSQRNVQEHKSILSGDLGVIDSISDNTYHVVYAQNLSNNSVLDGFIIKKGNPSSLGSANILSHTIGHMKGGGLYGKNIALTIKNCLFTDNNSNSIYVQTSGGAVYLENSNPNFINTVFSGNSGQMGGALYLKQSNPQLNNCLFYNNSANTSYSGSIFDGTWGLYYGWGASVFAESNSQPLFVNTTIYGNSAQRNGGVYYATNTGTNLQFQNCIIWGNTAPNDVLGVLNSGAMHTISNSVVQVGVTGSGNSNSNPNFYNPSDIDGSDNIIGTNDDGLKVLCNSPAVDSGTTNNVLSFDLTGNNRPLFGGVDIGAYEATGVYYYLDEDHDGYYIDSMVRCGSSDNSWVYPLPINGYGDCNDTDSLSHRMFAFYPDVDIDGVGYGTLTFACAPDSITPPTGYSLTNTDCAPEDATIWQNNLFYVDLDGDGFSSDSETVCYGYQTPAGYTTVFNGNDCDDQNANVHDLFFFYEDIDGDSYGFGDSTILVCAENDTLPPFGFSVNNSDCAQEDAMAWRNGLASRDEDRDGYSNIDSVSICYGTELPAEYTFNPLGVDCDDLDSSRHATFPFYADFDRDGYAGDSLFQYVCAVDSNTPPNQYFSNIISDCNDSDSLTHQVYNFYLDSDNDGFGAGAILSGICAQNSSTPPPGYALTNTDCNNQDSLVSPGFYEQCGNQIDENCNGLLNEDCIMITGPDSVCAKSSNLFSVIGVQGASSFVWSTVSSTGVTITGTSQTSKTIKFSNSGSYVLSVLPNTYSSPITKDIYVKPLPTGGIVSGDNPVCQNQTGTFTVSNSINATAYVWSAPSGCTLLNSSGNTATYQFGNNSSYTISVTPNNNGCASTSPRTMIVNTSLPAVGGTISGSTVTCVGTSNTYTISGVANTNSSTDYIWETSTGETISSTTATAKFGFTSPGTSIITVTPYNGNCRGNNITLQVYVHNAPTGTFNISGSASSCENQNKTFSTTAVSGVNYNWSILGTNNGTITAGQGTNSINVRFNGQYPNKDNTISITMTPHIASCSAATKTKTVKVSKTPANTLLSFSSDSACIGQNVIATAYADYASTYTWNISGATNAGSGSTSIRNITIGTANVLVRVTPKNGSCSSPQISKTIVYKPGGCLKIDRNETIDYTNHEASLLFFPNPAKDYVFIDMSELLYTRDFTLQLYNISGQMIMEKTIHNSESSELYELNVEELTNGYYVMKLVSNDFEFKAKLIVER